MSGDLGKILDGFIETKGTFSEDDLWDAIAEANGLEYSEVADGDLADWL